MRSCGSGLTLDQDPLFSIEVFSECALWVRDKIGKICSENKNERQASRGCILDDFIVYICDTGRPAAPASLVAPTGRHNQRLWLGHDIFALSCFRPLFRFSLLHKTWLMSLIHQIFAVYPTTQDFF
jgi:hypothetical protein